MGHQNILTLVDYFETMNNLYLVTDLALGGELFDRICRKGSYYESDAAELIRATLSAVAYLHDHGISAPRSEAGKVEAPSLSFSWYLAAPTH